MSFMANLQFSETYLWEYSGTLNGNIVSIHAHELSLPFLNNTNPSNINCIEDSSIICQERNTTIYLHMHKY